MRLHRGSSKEIQLTKEAILVSEGCHNQIPHTGWVKQEKLIFSKFWKLEVQDQEVNRFDLS